MSVLLWEQHNVGDAGFRTENRFAIFYSAGGDSAKFYVPIVHGTTIREAVDAVWEHFAPTDLVEPFQTVVEPADGFAIRGENWDIVEVK